MSKSESIPTDEKRNILSIDADLILTFGRLGLLCQLISGFTEMLGVYSFLDENLPTLPYYLHKTIVWGISFVVAMVLEMGTYKVITYSTYSTLGGKFKAKTASLVEWLKVIIPIVCLIGGIYFSMTISKRNVKFAVDANEISDIYDLSAYDQKAATAAESIKDDFKADKADLDKALASSRKLVESGYTSKKEVIQSKIRYYESEQKKGRGIFGSIIGRYGNDKRRLDQKEADALKPIIEKYNKDLKALKSRRDGGLDTRSKAIAAEKSEASQKNKEQREKKKARNEWLGFFLRELAGLSVLGFAVTRFWICLCYISAGATERKRRNVFMDFATLVWIFLTRKWHNWTIKKLSKFKPLAYLKENIVDAIADFSTAQSANGDKSRPTNPKKSTKKPTPTAANATNKLDGDLDSFSLNYVDGYDVEILGNNVAEWEVADRTIIGGFLPSMTAAKSGNLGNEKGGEKIGRIETAKSGRIGNIPPDFDQNKSGAKIGRLGDKKQDIDKARLDLDRSKAKYTEKQRKRVRNFYQKYRQKHGKKPSYKVIAIGLDLGQRAVGDYVRYLKGAGEL